jgi:membrane protein
VAVETSHKIEASDDEPVPAPGFRPGSRADRGSGRQDAEQPSGDPQDEPKEPPVPRIRSARMLCVDAWAIGRRCHKDSNRIELMHRALGFAALGFVTLVPLLIVIAAAAPLDGHTFPTWVAVGLGLTGNSADAVRNLFGPPGRVLSTTTALSLGTLAVFGLSFATAVQVGFERIWELPAARWYSVWRRVVWLAVLVGYLLGSADLVEVLHGRWYLSTAQLILSMFSSTAFFWWSVRFLLDNRIGWRALLPGALLTVGGLIGLRVFSAVLFSPLIISSALTYGAIGTVLVVVSWLIGVGFVVFGGAMCGRALAEARSAAPTTAETTGLPGSGATTETATETPPEEPTAPAQGE